MYINNWYVYVLSLKTKSKETENHPFEKEESSKPPGSFFSFMFIFWSVLHIPIVFLIYKYNIYTPENKHGTWKHPLGKGDTSTNHQFLGSMFVLGGVWNFLLFLGKKNHTKLPAGCWVPLRSREPRDWRRLQVLFERCLVQLADF